MFFARRRRGSSQAVGLRRRGPRDRTSFREAAACRLLCGRAIVQLRQVSLVVCVGASACTRPGCGVLLRLVPAIKFENECRFGHVKSVSSIFADKGGSLCAFVQFCDAADAAKVTVSSGILLVDGTTVYPTPARKK